MALDLDGIDPWAGRQPRRRDWALLGIGAALLLAGAVARWDAAGGAVAGGGTPVDPARWQEAASATRELNTAIAGIGRPWSRWLEHTVRATGANARLERLEAEPESHRIAVVWLGPAGDDGSAVLAALGGLPGARTARLTRSEPTAEGVRHFAEVSLP